MAQRLESASDISPLGGYISLAEGRQPALQATAGRDLPSSYGIALLELLVVDPEYVFISWEITDQQLSQARSQFGEQAFLRRRLRVEFHDAARPQDAPLASRELYGETGRWFIRLGTPGVWLRAVLKLAVAAQELALGEAGPVFVPRVEPVEPTEYRELRVRYGRGARGELTLEGFEDAAGAWPDVAQELQQRGRSAAGSAALFSRSAVRQGVDPGLLRPLLPVAPAALPAEQEEDLP